METGYLTSGQCYIQMALKVKNSSLIEKYSKKFFAICTPFHLSANLENMTLKLESKNNSLIKMPEEISSLDTAIKWSLENAHPNSTNNLATLSANSKIIVYNVNHAFCDGECLNKFLTNYKKVNSQNQN
jgi:Iap family predicted aminopeptidase